ncbi:MAG: hypothetical protein A2Y73_03135 [Chloroflexi bacterium RBG_13_56_8]|nr:MAG: hypothetical protein A2Y73_03135 [Chloroflexi bacterium RBG_13_56_8]
MELDGWKIRELREADLPQVISLWQEAGDYHDYLDTPPALVRVAEGGLFLVAEIENHIVGTVMGHYDGRMGFIARLAVVSDQRERGIATSLMREVERRLREKGAPQASLLVWHTNAPAMSLYEKLGYELIEGVLYMRKRFI